MARLVCAIQRFSFAKQAKTSGSREQVAGRQKRVVAAVVATLFLGASPRAAEISVATAAFPPGLGNPFTGVNQPSSEIWLAIFDALTVLDWGKEAKPALAVRWQMEAPTRWVFHLRPNVTFHDGTPFTARDVFGTIDILRATTYLVTGEIANVASATARDDLTVEIVTKVPDAILPKRLATMFIVNAARWNSVGPEAYARAPTGTGPYRLVSWGPANKLAELEAYAGAWRQIDGVDRFTYRVIAEQNARIQALMSGQVDLSTGLMTEDIADLEAAGIKVHVQPNPQLKSIALRTVRAGAHPLKDPRVRRALNHAVDKDAIADVMLQGHVVPVGQGAPPGLTGHNPDVAPYAYDPTRARALLAEAGYANGLSLKFDVVTGNATPDAIIYQKIAQDLAAVGVAVDLRTITFADYQGKYVTGKWGETDGFSQTWNNAAYQDPIRAVEYFSCLKPNPFFCDSALVPDIEAINAETNLTRREDMLKAYMARLHDAAPAIWITNAAYVIGHAPRIPAIAMLPTGVSFERLQVEGMP
ncbi:MAG: hypothetical protein FJX59_09820 [Alphaproteobacteria bacterium]|nr:hypothetical protein [Alphaproteobacteria bacterium]